MHALAEHYNYGELKEKLIRDRLAVGLQDLKLSEKLQLDSELILEKAVLQARQSEAVKKQQVLLRNDFQDEKEVNAIQKPQNKWKEKQGHDRQGWQLRKQPGVQNNTCPRCGGSPHSKQDCPAMGSVCFQCSKPNHYAHMCRSATNKKVHTLDQQSKPEPELFTIFINCISVQAVSPRAGGLCASTT